MYNVKFFLNFEAHLVVPFLPVSHISLIQEGFMAAMADIRFGKS